ncbi:radical SAM domain-containing protein [Thauera phenylacetica B4P]|uniref:Radical SAM domain-containing protein n=1 Tax=Thauera phenylacetica B4P TaxID=1234382 RepID=N7A3H7_9RHOO|nr:radical SAM protein [Thauera phenylacetica]ENO98829.1 radical SAM domain-containing protein [Thauera phenylacetica B4P]
MDIAFGPVPSRRLGRSLGINNIPPKHCSYACVYCQVGPTPEEEISPRPSYRPEEILRQVRMRLEAVRAHGDAVDYLTFVPDGEPTLDSRLGESIDALRELGLPIAVISNASLLWYADVRSALRRADWVSVKVDSVVPGVWERINRPHGVLRLADILGGIQRFASEFAGRLVSETMLVAGLNDGDEDIAALGRFIATTRIGRAYLAIPHRPPAVAGVRGPDEAVVLRAFRTLADKGLEVELLTAYEGDVFAFGGDLRVEILAISAVHPLRTSAIQALLDKGGGSMALVDALLASGELRRLEHEGEVFYLRRLHREG